MTATAAKRRTPKKKKKKAPTFRLRITRELKTPCVMNFKTQADLGQLLAARREQKMLKDGQLEKWSRQGLAGKLKWNRSTLARIEEGERWPEFERLQLLLDVLDLQLLVTSKGSSEKLSKV